LLKLLAKQRNWFRITNIPAREDDTKIYTTLVVAKRCAAGYKQTG